MMASWREGTKAQYDTYIRKWSVFCKKVKCDLVTPPVPIAIDFLASLFDAGLSYASINTARSALSSVLLIENSKIPFGQLPLVKRFMKGIFELKPSLPRYRTVWNVSTVFNYLRCQPNIADLSLKDLSLRLTFLLLLLSGQRCQTVYYFTMDNMKLSEDKCVFKVTDKVKQTRKGYHIPPIIYECYPHETRLCPVVHIKEYVKRTASLRSADCKQLLVSFIRPHGPVSKTTIARWCKLLLGVAGVDTTNFHCHSTRAASTSYAADGNVNVSCILKAVGWSNEHTFQKFYHKPCVESSFNLGSAVLDMHLCCSIVRFSFMQYLCCVISMYTNAFKVIQNCSHEIFY